MASSEDRSSKVNGHELSEDNLAIAANIERYLNNHTREGSHAWQMNMAARQEAWHPLGEERSSGSQPGIANAGSE